MCEDTRSPLRMTSTQLEQQVRTRLVEYGVRFTSGRRLVIEALAAADGPRSAAELHEDLRRSVPVSSLYRSLAVLADAGVLAPHHGTRGLTRYELAEWLSGHHHHFVCIGCGAVDDVELPAELEATLEQLVSRVAGTQQFAASGHALEIDGHCRACA